MKGTVEQVKNELTKVLTRESPNDPFIIRDEAGGLLVKYIDGPAYNKVLNIIMPFGIWGSGDTADPENPHPQIKKLYLERKYTATSQRIAGEFLVWLFGLPSTLLSSRNYDKLNTEIIQKLNYTSMKVAVEAALLRVDFTDNTPLDLQLRRSVFGGKFATW